MINGNQKTYTLAELREKAKQCIDDLDSDDLQARLYLSCFIAWLQQKSDDRRGKDRNPLRIDMTVTPEK